MTLTKTAAVAAAKSFRQRLDALLQEMKDHRFAMVNRNNGVCAQMLPASQMSQEQIQAAKIARAEYEAEQFLDSGEAVAQHVLSIRDLESAIMRQGMALKYIGTPNPYPSSKDPSSPVVEPTADGLKL